MPVFVDGYEMMVPTSIASTGSGNSSSISTNGSVSFSSCATLELRGVFTSSYDNYLMVMRYTSTVGGTTISIQLMSGTTPAAGATDYVYQYAYASSSSVSGARTTQSSWSIVGVGTGMNGATVSMFGPYLAQPTVVRALSSRDNLGAELFDNAATHALSTSYDGLKLTTGASGLATGLVAIYGAVK